MKYVILSVLALALVGCNGFKVEGQSHVDLDMKKPSVPVVK